MQHRPGLRLAQEFLSVAREHHASKSKQRKETGP